MDLILNGKNMIPFKKNLFSYTFVGMALVGCGSSDGNKETIQSADNQTAVSEASTDTSTKPEQQPESSEQIELTVLSLAQDADIDQLTTKISVEVTDPSALIKELILLVDGVEVQKLTQSPWFFDWNNYYWANSSSLNLSVKAIAKDGKSYTLDDAIKVNMSEKIAELLKFESLGDASLKDTDKVTVKMVAVNGAASYEIEYTDAEGESEHVRTEAVRATISDLAVGNYSLRFRAINTENQAGPWSDAAEISILPPDLPVLSDPVFTKSNEGYQLVFEQTDLSTDTELNISLINEVSEPIDASVKENHKVSFNGLKPGNFRWSASITNQYGHQSLRSVEKELVLPNPNTPTISSVTFTEESGQFFAQLEWGSEDDAESYNLQIRNSSSQDIIAISEPGLSLTQSLDAGEYTVEIQQVDMAGDTSAWSTPYEFTVGEFDIALVVPEVRDSNSPLPSVIALDNNEHIVFSGNISQNSSKFFKVNVLGETVIEKSIDRSDSEKLVKLIQISENKLLSIGHTINAINGHSIGLLVEFDNNGDVVSEYTTSTLIEGKLNYRFIDVVEANGRVFVLGQLSDTNSNFIAEIKAQNISNFVLIDSHDGNTLNAQYLNVTGEGNIAIAGHVGSKLVVRSFNTALQLQKEWVSPDDISTSSLEGLIVNQESIVVTGLDQSQVNAHYFKLSSNDLQLTANSSDYVIFNAEFHHAMQLAQDGTIKLFIDEGSSYNYLVARTYNSELVRDDHLQHYENMKVYSAPIFASMNSQHGTLFTVMWELGSNQLRIQQKAQR
ncbi:hypothetical protein L1077_19735 [Pseudoalteromonas luteoviolacea]|uniref:hypothetical protein n=1 Tax=Pseudoalteromonas luteoviolacea TaxID=43657 RepID=UPI001F2D7D4B|nr:hypothetical protein [Pseudoalteromonas luteoviolacea]MCF6441671.1 hypothetical protein [Pseudoalteromonas luteoviolacea]